MRTRTRVCVTARDVEEECSGESSQGRELTQPCQRESSPGSNYAFLSLLCCTPLGDDFPRRRGRIPNLENSPNLGYFTNLVTSTAREKQFRGHADGEVPAHPEVPASAAVFAED